MNTLKSAFARTALVLAFVVSGCASVAPFENVDVLSQMHDSSQGGGD
jgi:hypothetical protein